MSLARKASILAPALVAWVFFALDGIQAVTVWAGVGVMIPDEFMMLAGGLAGTAGMFILGLLAWVFWGVLGLLLGLLAEGSDRA
ncbi:hypothetical protein [Pseudomonas sp.]|jgi:hypothetical protein|uniref:hypothetical protein n=1 Tax=Pseudomonas sp. TaxID=306 RepID=UPI0037C9E6F3